MSCSKEDEAGDEEKMERNGREWKGMIDGKRMRRRTMDRENEGRDEEEENETNNEALTLNIKRERENGKVKW
jgi:hypothetical protein